MKNILFILLVILFPGVFHGQGNIDGLLKLKPQEIEAVYEEELQSEYSMLLPMYYSSAELSKNVNKELAEVGSVIIIELFYTDFQRSGNFNQPKLNKSRFQALEKLIPGITSNPDITWKIYAQSGMASVKDAEKCFHGFRIIYLPKTMLYTLEKEAGIVDSLTSIPEFSFVTKTLKCDTIVKKKTKKIGYLPVSAKKREKGIVFSRKSIWNRKSLKETYYETSYRCDSVVSYELSDSTREFFRRNMADSTILDVFQRNPEWDNICVVADVTGSMSAYTFQLLLWNRMVFDSNKVRAFVFFNDGDSLPDHQKLLGNTGGIYMTEPTTIKQVDSLMFYAMGRGGGGDIPENNLEALRNAQQTYPDAVTFVMIADNYAPVKDMSLLRQIRKPVHIVVCGSTDGYIHPDYLKIAYETNGSVHTMEHDLNTMFKLGEPGGMPVGDYLYSVKSGKILFKKSMD